MKFVSKLIMMVAIVIGLIFGTASFAQADEPAVDLANIQYAQAQFQADGSAAAKASLKAQSGAKVVLNVHVNPMPKQQIKRCWKVKPGTWIWNEVIDPATGTKKVVRWQVPSNDNTFCTKKGAGKQVFKKSCGNRVWGVPGGPKYPPKSIPRIKVKVQIQDYLTFKGKLMVQTSQSGSASAYVVQYYDGKKVCEASASVSGTGYVSVEAYISVRARTFTGIKVSATNSAQVNANTQITASGSLKAAVKLVLEGKASAMCNFTPPDNPPVFEKPSIDLTVEPCVPGETVLDVTAVVGNPNDSASAGTIKFGSRSPVSFGSIAAGGSSAPIVFQNVSPGTYTVTATLTEFDTTTSTQVIVPSCPPENPPVFVQFREFNDLEVNWVDDHCVTVDLPAGHTATVYWEADFGSFAIPQKTAQDGVQICSDYKAPSEVPAGGTDTIHVRVVDNQTDLSVSKSTDPFVIHPTAPHPG